MVTLRQYQEQCRADDLTIVSVSFGTSSLLALNFQLTKALNREIRYWWLIIDNKPEDYSCWPKLEEVVVVPGTQIGDIERQNIAYGSLHHAKSLNIGMAYAQSDIVLVLDPDCYILQPDWILKIKQMMERDQLTFWGTPYHPERLAPFNVFGRTFIYFPTAICMFINRRILYKKYGFIIDFTPPIHGRFYEKEYYSLTLMKLKRQKRNPLKWIRQLYRYGPSGVIDGLRTASDKWSIDKRIDIGHIIFERYSMTKFGYAHFYFGKKFPPGFILWRHLVPQSWLGYPKDMTLWHRRSFPFVPDNLVQPGRWEQFYFDNQPFALHVGAVTYRSDTVKTETVRNILQRAVEPSMAAAL